MASPDVSPVRPRRPRNPATSFIRELVIVVVGAIVISTVLRAFVGQMFIIPSPSMEHTLDVQDRIAVSKVNSIHRGSVVVFSDAGDWLGGSVEEEETNPVDRVLQFIGFPVDAKTSHLVKRVIGMPGDHVVCCDTKGRITVNGQALDETSYLRSDGSEQVKPSDFGFNVTVPAGRIWVMGDNRSDSADSRCHLDDPVTDGPKGMNAFVPESAVVGPAVAVVFPLGRATTLPIPSTFDAVPDASGSPPSKPTIKKGVGLC